MPSSLLRVLVAALAAPGHLFPVIPVARALRAAGHHVTVATHRSGRASVEAAGLRWVPAGLDMHDAFARAVAERAEDPTEPDRAADLVGHAFGGILARSVVDDLAPWFERSSVDLVIAEAGCPGAALAARRAGVPCVVHAIGRRIDPCGPMSTAITTRVRALAEALDLDPQHVGHTLLDICPPSLQHPGSASGDRELAVRPTMWNPPVPFVDRRGEPGRRPWVYLTLGTAGGEETTVRTAIEGLAVHDVDVLVAAGAVGAESLRDLERSPRVQVEPFVPAARLMHRFDLVVHHGGSGTTLGAAAVGAPQVLLPWGADQFDNAAAIEAVGAGRALTAHAELTRETLADAVALMVSGHPRAATRALAAEIEAMPSPAAVADRVDGWR